MHIVVTINRMSLISIERLNCLNHGWEKPSHFRSMHWVFNFSAKILIFSEENHDFIPIAAICIRPMPYNVNLDAIKLKKNRILLDL